MRAQRLRVEGTRARDDPPPVCDRHNTAMEQAGEAVIPEGEFTYWQCPGGCMPVKLQTVAAEEPPLFEEGP